jgi:hypothetical protein
MIKIKLVSIFLLCLPSVGCTINVGGCPSPPPGSIERQYSPPEDKTVYRVFFDRGKNRERLVGDRGATYLLSLRSGQRISWGEGVDAKVTFRESRTDAAYEIGSGATVASDGQVEIEVPAPHNFWVEVR